MIVVTRLNGSRFAVNPDLIERIHESPDTHLVTLDGATYVVQESLADVVDLIANYRAYVLSRAREFPAVTGYPLTLVPAPEPDDGRSAGGGSAGEGPDDGGPAAGPATPLRPGR
jgi:flagellar protein FlbD